MNDNDFESGDMAGKPSEYVHALLKEKICLDSDTHPHAMRLLDEEVQKAQAQTQQGRAFRPDARFVDVCKDKPAKVSAKVVVPVREHPTFNFVGKLLGPKGNTLRRLQEDTMTKMAILGRGSMRDKAKEEELRQSGDPKYAHLSDDLHVEVVAMAAPAEGYARLAYAMAELRKYLVPDKNDDIQQEQFRELQQAAGGGAPPPWAGRAGGGGGGGPRGPPPMRGGGVGGRGSGPPRPPMPPMVPPMPMPPVPRLGVPMPHRPAPVDNSKTKVFSILERARNAMEETSYGGKGAGAAGGAYNDGYYNPPAAGGYGGGNGSYNGSGNDYYGSGGYSGGGGDSGVWKSYGNSDSLGSGGGKAPLSGNRYGGNARSAPYGQRPKYDPTK